MTRVLVVDDDAGLCSTLEAGLAKRGYAVVCERHADAGFQRLLADDFDVVLTDIKMPDVDGITFCKHIADNRPDVPVIVMTGFGNYDSAVAAIRAGAYDFIAKPVRLDVLGITLDRAAQTRALRDAVKRLQTTSHHHAFEGMIASSSAMRRVHDIMDRVADSEAPILITGESGSGKKTIARHIHRNSRRAHGLFVVADVMSMPEAVLELELFGAPFNTESAANADRRTTNHAPSLLAQARGGTLFLSHIGHLSPSLQTKLLRALPEPRTRSSLASNDDAGYDVRIIAGTSSNLREEVEEGRFREDLYFRLNVVDIAIPALRSRVGDILPLAQSFVETYATRARKAVVGISSHAAEKLISYTWPGNVRELQNVTERAVALARFDQIAVDDLPERIRSYQASHIIVAASDPEELVTMDEVERRYVAQVLAAVGGNKAAAARVLGWERKTLYRKLERWETRKDDES